MSAFVLPEKHINTLLSYANAINVNLYIPQEDGSLHILNSCDVSHLQEAAEILYAQNVRSVCARYDDESPDNYAPISFRFVPGSRSLPPVQIIKACDCYDYQACETRDYDQTQAARIINDIRHYAVSRLPGYDEAEWDID